MEPRILGDHVVFPVPDGAVLQSVLGLKVATIHGQDYAAVPYDLPTVRFFRNQGVKLPHPITTKYNWPGRFTPFQHQIETAEFLTLHPRAFVLSGMGTGKSKAALWAADYLMRLGQMQKCIIFSPLSTLDRVWAQEIFETLPHRQFRIVYGSRQKRFDLLDDRKADFYITNHDAHSIIYEKLAARPDINHVIIDEVACVRNAQSQRAKTLGAIVNKQHPRTCWGLTGTPTPTAPTDCYGQLRVVTPERYKSSFKALQNELMYQVSTFRWVPRSTAAARVNELMQPSIRFALEDCIDLPETIWSERECELSDEQAKAYKEMKATAMAEVKGEQVTAVNAAVLLGKLLQASVFGMYVGDGKAVELDFGPRYRVLEEIIEECNEKVIVFVPFTAALEAFAARLKKKWSVAVVDGSVPAGQRNTIFREFQTLPNPHVILAHPGTMAHGLTLTAASTIVWAAPTTSNETFTQANARIVRPGQKHVTNVVMIQGSPAERGLYKTLKERGKMQDLLLALAKGG